MFSMFKYHTQVLLHSSVCQNLLSRKLSIQTAHGLTH
jgi:hypothetical protein